jgi:hypothetical protein
VTQPVDSSILHEIVRVIESRRKVPDKVVVKGREYQLTYLEDHQRRFEEALQRYDSDRLNMLYGQLASKIKYQMLRRVPTRAPGPEARPAKKASAPKPAPVKAKKVARPKVKAVSARHKPKKAAPVVKKAARTSREPPRRAAARRK